MSVFKKWTLCKLFTSRFKCSLFLLTTIFSFISPLVFYSNNSLDNDNSLPNTIKVNETTNNHDINPLIDLEGIDNVTIDHRVVDINIDTWAVDNKISASELDGYEYVTSDAFYLYMDDINEIEFPNTIKTIEPGAINSARDKLKKVVIPASVTNMDGNIFVDTNVQELEILNTNLFEFENGALYNKREKKLLAVFPYAADSNNVIHIKSDTTAIGSYAFSNLHGAGKYTAFKLDMNDFKNVTTIDPYAFYNANVDAIEILSNFQQIGTGAFSGLIGTNVTSSNSRYTLDKYNVYDVLVDKNTDTAMAVVNDRFVGDTRLTMNVNYKYIADHFCDLNLIKISKLVFGPKVVSIGDSAFNNFWLDSIEFADNAIVSTIGDFVFANTNSQNSGSNFNITFPDSVISIGEAVFYNSNDGVVNIPSSVEYIGTGINFNAARVNINLDENNPYYYFENGLLIDKRKKSVISYDYDYLVQSETGRFIVPEDVVYIEPRSLTMLISNRYFRGIDILNPNIVIGNGAFLNSGTAYGNYNEKLDITVPSDTPLELKRYIITSVMSWEFGPIQDSNLTGYGGGSWRGTVNGQEYQPLEKPSPFPPPAQNSTTVVLDNAPRDLLDFLPSTFSNMGNAYFKTWFSIINPSIEPPTRIELTAQSFDNLTGSITLAINIYHPLVSNQVSNEVWSKEYQITGMRRSINTTLSQVFVPEQKINVPDDINDLYQYIDFTNTGDVINHDYINSYSNPYVIKTTYTIEQILNSKYGDGYYDSFYDYKLHLRVRVDNYYDEKGVFRQTSNYNYKPLYLIVKLSGFNLYRRNYQLKEDVVQTNLIIIFVIIGVIVIALIIAIILMNWKRRRK